jgi:Family of unknown function (DUF6370)
MFIRAIFSILILSCITITAHAQMQQPDISKPDPAKKIQMAEVSCGQCKFHLKGKSCDLAIRIKGKAWFADGAHIDSFGDAHAKNGFCKAISKAEVQGEIINNRFKVTYLKLLPPKK